MGERSYWNFYSAGRLVFGCDSIRELPAILDRQGLRRILIVTDATLVSVGIVSRVQEVLSRSSVEVELFDGGQAEPEIAVAIEAASVAVPFNPDAVIGIGGGSNMDLAKIVTAIVTFGGEPADYFGYDRVPGPVRPLICIPTTSGTGSEVSHAAVLTDSAQQIKVSTLSQYLRPAVAIVDPQLTISCPAQATADSGIDALTHAIEALNATDFDRLQMPAGEDCPYSGRHPLGNCLAREAIRLVGQHLVHAVRTPDDIEARVGMAMAATLAGLAFSNCGVAVVHALEYPIGGSVHCSHGLGNGLLLPYVMRFNIPERTRSLGEIARLLGKDTSGLDEVAAAQQAIEAVIELRREIGIPERLRDIGVQASQLPEFAAKAFAIKRLMLLNGRAPQESDLLGILQEAY